ncbi:MAG: (d)CMP kinase [Planctomycetes bacterium]|nr:(d)CMP kinase [Planctomycetota bacterium]
MAGDESIVTIDGPAGSGKTTVARNVAQRLGFRFLDTGAMYRAAALAALDRGVSLDPLDAAGAVSALRAADLSLAEDGAVTLGGASVEDRIRGPEVTRAVSAVAAVPEVRRQLTELQRRFAARAHPGLVAEGRDMATVVFPCASHRFYLDASVAERARRRVEELRQHGGEAPGIEAMIALIRARDEKDAGREAAPLCIGRGVRVIDTTALALDEVVERILAELGARQ